MDKKGWLRALVGGPVWAAVYNSVWGIALFAFMQQEWLRASASVDWAYPWTPQFWTIWIPMTVPFGVAIMAYLASRPKRTSILLSVLAASVALWVPSTIGMAVWASQESLSPRTIVLDSLVNAVALIAASLFGSWLIRAARRE